MPLFLIPIAWSSNMLQTRMSDKESFNMNPDLISRRVLLKQAGALGLMAAVEHVMPAWALMSTADAGSQTTLSGNVIDLTISEKLFRVDGRTGTAITINGTIPGPIIRLKEGQPVTLRVMNRLTESTSIHWHGILLPPDMDGVPGVSFRGIEPGETFTYRFPVKLSGTYWFHSHSGGQELSGMYAPMIIDPIEPEPFQYDREYVVMFSDWSFESAEILIDNLKKRDGYYNFQKRTAREFFSDVSRMGLWPALNNYLMWDQMRMDPTDFADVTGYAFSYLMNGLSPAGNWTGLFRSGEKVRLRFINAASMTLYPQAKPTIRWRSKSRTVWRIVSGSRRSTRQAANWSVKRRRSSSALINTAPPSVLTCAWSKRATTGYRLS